MKLEMPRLRLPAGMTLVALALLAPGCGDDNSNTTTQAAQPATTAPTTPEETPPAPETQPTKYPKTEKVQPPPGEANPNKKPKVTVPPGPPPKKLVVQDLIIGKGKRAKNGPAVAVQYVGVLYKNGKEFDSSWTGARKHNPFGFALGMGQVIAGWDQGVPGMRVGGRRKLIIPASLAYGKQGLPPKIPPNSALVFDIDLVKAY
jgi:FKBP-type peptidyl-prolyl cis-trans isomerase